MRRATAVIAAADMPGRKAADTVRLDYDHRHRRRLVLETVGGERVLLDLPQAVHLRGGDGLLTEDGRIVAVEALPEPLLEITAPDAAALVRIAWHLGNRHLPTQLAGNALRIREDHVLEDMVKGLGGTVRTIAAPFDPEGGAYAGAGGRHHHHHDDDDHHHHHHEHHHG